MSDILKGTSLLTVGDVLTRLFDLVRVIVITHVFSVAEYGLFSLAVGTALILAGFAMPSFGAVVLQFFPQYQKEDEECEEGSGGKKGGGRAAATFFSSSMMILLFNGLIFMGLFVFLANWVGTIYYQKPEITMLLYFAASMIVLSPFVSNLLQFFFSLNRFKSIFAMNALGGLMNLLFVLLFVYLGLGIPGLILAYVISEASKVLLALVLLRKYMIFTVPRLSKEIWSFWKPLIATAIFKAFTNHLPTVLIGRLLDTFAIGIYNIVDRTLRLTFSMLDPYLMTIKAVAIRTSTHSREKFLQILNQHNTYTVLACIFVIGLMPIVFGPLGFSLLYGDEYMSALPYFFVYTIFGVIGTVNGSFPRVIYSVANKNNYYLLVTVLTSVVQLSLMLWLMLWLGLWGLILSLVVGRLIGLSLNIYFSKRADEGFSVPALLGPLSLYAVLVVLGVLSSFFVEISFSWIVLLLTFVYIWAASLLGFIEYRTFVPGIYKELRKLVHHQ